MNTNFGDVDSQRTNFIASALNNSIFIQKFWTFISGKKLLSSFSDVGNLNSTKTEEQRHFKSSDLHNVCFNKLFSISGKNSMVCLKFGQPVYKEL
jgi:hypothetical protein